ncbi:unnamed protein product [Prunus brigantina]
MEEDDSSTSTGVNDLEQNSLLSTSHDSRVVNTTYKGTHNHGDGVPATRGGGNYSAANKPAFDSSSNNMSMAIKPLDLSNHSNFSYAMPFQNIDQPTTETQSPYTQGSDGFPGLQNIMSVQLARDVRESLVSISNMEKAIDQIEGSGSV